MKTAWFGLICQAEDPELSQRRAFNNGLNPQAILRSITMRIFAFNVTTWQSEFARTCLGNRVFEFGLCLAECCSEGFTTPQALCTKYVSCNRSHQGLATRTT